MKKLFFTNAKYNKLGKAFSKRPTTEKKLAKRITIAILFTVVTVTSCKENLVNDNSGKTGNVLQEEKENSLVGTKWKLAGIVDTETGVLTELEPKDCDECYTLTFDTDSTFLTFSPANDLEGGYIADYETYSFQILDFGGTKVGEIGDAELYTDLFWNRLIQFFSIQNNKLRLYYNDKKNYLLFKSQQP